jgi:Fe2+ transport system protein FeoA
MINIYHLKRGDKGRIVKINAGKTLKARMKSFGIYPGVEFEIKAFSLGKNNVELQVGRSLVALRKGEMDKIEVEKIEDEEV